MQFKIVFILTLSKLVHSQGYSAENKDVIPSEVHTFIPNKNVNNDQEYNVNYGDNSTKHINKLRSEDGLVSEIFDWVMESEGRALSESNGKLGSGGGGGGHGGKGKGKGKGKKQQGFMERILPMMVMPFLVSTSMIPMMLITLLGMLFKSAIIGKIGIILMIINMFRSRNSGGGVYSHNVNMERLAMEHYGYQGDEEYGAYINRKRRRKRNV